MFSISSPFADTDHGKKSPKVATEIAIKNNTKTNV
jgi:hypothetical protein